MTTEVFEHRVTYTRSNGLDVLDIEITFDDTYTIKLTHTGPSVGVAFWPKEVSYIRNISYLPDSVLYMLSATGDESGSVQKLIQVLTQLCSETLEKEKNENVSKLQEELSSAAEKIDSLQYELDSANHYIQEIEMRNREFYAQLYPEGIPDLDIYPVEGTLDEMLEDAFFELNM